MKVQERYGSGLRSSVNDSHSESQAPQHAAEVCSAAVRWLVVLAIRSMHQQTGAASMLKADAVELPQETLASNVGIVEERVVVVLPIAAELVEESVAGTEELLEPMMKPAA